MDSIVFPTLPTYVGAPTLAGLLSLAVTVLLPIIAALFSGPRGRRSARAWCC